MLCPIRGGKRLSIGKGAAADEAATKGMEEIMKCNSPGCSQEATLVCTDAVGQQIAACHEHRDYLPVEGRQQLGTPVSSWLPKDGKD